MERNKWVLKLIKKYQKNKAIIGTGHCKFYPTCSVYAYETFKKFNFFYAFILTSIRLLRCNPLAKRRYYPVKLTKNEKLAQKYLKTIDQYLNEPFTSFIATIDQSNIDNLFPFIYDYYYHPIYATHESSKFTFPNQYIISDQLLPKLETHHNYHFDELLKITNELITNEYLTKPLIEIPVNTSDKYIYFLDELNIVDILKLNNITKGAILINNYLDAINYLDFKEIDLDDKNIKMLDELINQNFIIKTKTNNIVKYLPYVTFSINCYKTLDEIDYLYHINKRL